MSGKIEKKQEDEVKIEPEITIAVSYGRPRMVIKDHKANDMKQYEVIDLQSIKVKEKPAGLLIKAVEIHED